MKKVLNRVVLTALVLMLAVGIFPILTGGAVAVEVDGLVELIDALAQGETDITLKGVIEINADTPINLSSDAGATIHAAAGERHFEFGGPAKLDVVLNINNITLQGGDQSGGIVCKENVNQLTITGGVNPDGTPNAVINGCKWELSGKCTGGVHVAAGDLIMENCIVSNNSATILDFSQCYGGGVGAAMGTVTLTNCVITGNQALTAGQPAARGGGVWGYGVTITDSVISGNSAPNGGGIYSEQDANKGGPAVVRNSTISNNTALSTRGGGIYAHGIEVYDCDIFDNIATTEGGGLCSTSAGMIIENCNIYDNEAKYGGGIATRPVVGTPADSAGSVKISGTKIIGNKALLGDGGGIWLSIGGTSNWVEATGAQIQLDTGNMETNTFSDNVSQKAYANTEYTTSGPFSFGLVSLFNGYDVYPVPTDTEAKFYTVTVNYYQNQTTGNHLGTESFLYTGELTEAGVATALGASWLNAHKPGSGYMDGTTTASFPVTLSEDYVIDVIYSPAAVNPNPNPNPNPPIVEPVDPWTVTDPVNIVGISEEEGGEIPLGSIEPPTTGDKENAWLGCSLMVLSLMLGSAAMILKKRRLHNKGGSK